MLINVLKSLFRKEIPFAIFAFGLFVPLCYLPVQFAFGFFASGFYDGGVFWLGVVLVGFLIMILVPALAGWYLGHLRLVRYLAYTVYAGFLGYAVYTVYEALTCTEEKCGLVIIFALIAIIVANFFLFSFIHNLKQKSILAAIKIALGAIAVGTLQWFFMLFGFASFGFLLGRF